MSDGKDNGGLYGPQDDGAQDTDDALLKSQDWRHITPAQKENILRGERILATERPSALEKWRQVGSSCFDLRIEVAKECGGATEGKLYNQWWRAKATPELRKLEQSSRSRAIWLFENYEVVKDWWDDQPADSRDRWNHPSSIQSNYIRLTSLPPLQGDEEDDDDEKKKKQKASWEEAQDNRQRLLDEAIGINYQTAEHLGDRVTETTMAMDEFKQLATGMVAEMVADVRRAAQPFTATTTDAEWFTAVTSIASYNTVFALHARLGDWLEGNQPPIPPEPAPARPRRRRTRKKDDP